MKTLTVLLFVLGTLSVTAAPEPAPVAAQINAEELMKIESDARCGQLLVTALVGGEPMRMMLDTGATHTVLHEESAAKIKNARRINPNPLGMFLRKNTKQAPKMLLAALLVGPGEADMHPMAVMNLNAVRNMLAEKVDGIVGMDFLGALPFTHDFRKKEYYWGVPEGASLVPLRTEPAGGGRVNVLMTCGGKELKLLLDTGSTITRVPAGEWAPGVGAEIIAQIGNVDSASEQKLVEGKPGDMELAPGVVLKGVAPLLGAEGEPAILGLDALKDAVLIHIPSATVEGGQFFMVSQ